MKLRRSILYVLTLGLLCLYGGQCKKRRHHHKKLLAEDGANGDVAAAATSDAPGAAPVPATGPVVDQTAAAVTPADTNVPVVASAPQIVPQNAAPDPPPTAAEAAPAADTSTKEKIQKSDSDSKDANQKESYRWTNHSIPFLKRFKKEIDGGKIKHHNYEEMTWFLKYFAEEFPDITRLYSIGRSVQNRKLWVLEISDNPGQHDPGEPEMKYIGNVHGNEVIGREILLQLVKHLCTNYEDDADIKGLVDNTRIHILPSLNPDGYELAATHKKSLNPDITEDVIGRLNANGVDLNRNFPDQFFEANTDSFEPESEAVMTWIRRYPFALSASFHSGALVVTYPFDDSPSGQTQYSATPDDDLFRQISKTYSENHPKMHLANPHEINCTRALKRFTDGISNGASWSPLTGGMQDYNYVRSNCYEVTVELGCEKFPREENLKTYWEENKKSLIKFIEFTNRGVKGFVKDHQGNPIKGARISVGDRKHDVRSAIDGDYFRLLVPGTYELECHAKGFKRNAANVEIPIGGQVVVNFTMLPKQIDELEEALGHVNKATLLSHDLMYRFDGRDSGNAAPKEVMAKVEAQRTGAAERSGDQDPEPDSSLENPSARIVDPETALVNPNASLIKTDSTREYAPNPITVKPPNVPPASSPDAETDKAHNRSPEKSESPAEKSESSAESSGESPSPSLFQAVPPLKRITGRRTGHSDLRSFSNVFDTPFTDIINTKHNQVQIKNTPIITNTSLDSFLSTSSPKRIEDILQKVSKLTDIGKDTAQLNKARDGSIANMLSGGGPQAIDEVIKETVVAKYHPHQVPYLGMKISCKVPSIDRLNGTLRFLGYINNLPKKSDRIIAGLELDGEQNLGTDGTFLGKRYFTAPPKHGYFVPFESCL